MDVLTGLLDGPRARNAFLLRSLLEPPWSLRLQDESPLTIAAILRGDAWLDLLDGSPPVRLGVGDVAVVRGPDPYVLADAAGRPPQIVVHPGQRCTTLDGVDLHDAMTLGVRTWGNDPDGSTSLLCGTYEVDGAVSDRLLAALPRHLVVGAGRADQRLVDLLAEEVLRDGPGQQVMLDRLLDLLLVSTLRQWFAECAEDAPGWFRAAADPIVGPAIRLLHDEPARQWTVASLAAEVGASRAAFARRFAELMGEPPMTYLTNWRLALAADLLLEPGATLGSVARRVGYASPYALSSAFSRVRGVSPKEHRTEQLAAVGGP
ncbi:AraC family transcriptional regulator [Actinomarinicola tropica]|uniref:Helix-turn-helix domain-containing protein n=1 Tax=Actinomarinicola tropica TaxID=2789776 RepID=A0A5Q2RFJ5_9ACTN|nr:AraC family transcriptional regulator [Actinomarinicola tropica]QGG94414.1 helix-turn-helix domain-containing protein [Actinomarinicola tropica]